MKLDGVTWKGPNIDDSPILNGLSPDLRTLLQSINGFILHYGALHIRGACREPAWHSLRNAMEGDSAFSQLYDDVLPTDVPFAQDQVGDQYFLRDNTVIHLDAETGDIDDFATSLAHFFANVEADIEEFLNVGLEHKLCPGELLHAAPPFCAKGDGERVSLRSCSALDVISFHADLAKQIKDLPDGSQITFVIK